MRFTETGDGEKMLEKILKEIEARVNYYRDNAAAEYVDVCAGLREAEGIIRKCSAAEKITNNGWIPVEERLPDQKGEYLVTYHPCYWDNVEKDVKVGLDTFRGKNSWAKKKYQRVIAWQPLPEPYRKE